MSSILTIGCRMICQTDREPERRRERRRDEDGQTSSDRRLRRCRVRQVLILEDQEPPPGRHWLKETAVDFYFTSISVLFRNQDASRHHAWAPSSPIPRVFGPERRFSRGRDGLNSHQGQFWLVQRREGGVFSLVLRLSASIAVAHSLVLLGPPMRAYVVKKCGKRKMEFTCSFLWLSSGVF